MHEVDLTPLPINSVDLYVTRVQEQVGAFAPIAVSTMSAHAPVVTGVRGGLVNAVVATEADTAHAPNVGGSTAAFVAAPRSTYSGRANVPVVTTDVTVNVPRATSTGLAISPVASALVVNVNAVRATETAKALAPVVSGEVVLTGGGPGVENLIAIPPTVAGTAGGGTVLFDAVGAGSFSTNTVTPLTWTHTCTGTNRAVIVGFAVDTYPSGGNLSGWTRTVTYGGVAMTSLQSRNSADSANGWVELFGLLNPPTGAQTVSAVATRSGFTPSFMNACSVSYSSVASFNFGASGQTSGTGGPAPSITVSSGVNHRAVAVFCSGASISAPTQTQRYLHNFGNVGYAENFLIQDAAGASPNVTFSAAANNDAWGLVAVSMLPA